MAQYLIVDLRIGTKSKLSSEPTVRGSLSTGVNPGWHQVWGTGKTYTIQLIVLEFREAGKSDRIAQMESTYL